MGSNYQELSDFCKFTVFLLMIVCIVNFAVDHFSAKTLDPKDRRRPKEALKKKLFEQNSIILRVMTGSIYRQTTHFVLTTTMTTGTPMLCFFLHSLQRILP